MKPVAILTPYAITLAVFTGFAAYAMDPASQLSIKNMTGVTDDKKAQWAGLGLSAAATLALVYVVSSVMEE